MDQFVESFAEKLVLLERAMGARIPYRAIQPIRLTPFDSTAIQSAAKQIADAVGLGDFVFIVGVVRQKANAAGHIELKDGSREVFIEVSDQTMQYPDAVVATLCHEVCHKWLHVNGISSGVEHENEILTDIATVFLGFGKIMLNGCEAGIVRREGDRMITERMNVGYLDRDQIAFIYRLVCAMRRIPRDDYMSGLNGVAVQAIEQCDGLYGHYYNEALHNAEAVEAIADSTRALTAETQQVLANLDKHIAYIDRACCAVSRDFLGATHRRLADLQKHHADLCTTSELDPALRFLRNVCLPVTIGKMNVEIRRLNDEAQAFLARASALGREIRQDAERFPAPHPGMFSVVTCYRDGTRLRLPESSGEVVATCPKCRYRFAYNTQPIAFPEIAPEKQKRSWLQRLFAGRDE